MVGSPDSSLKAEAERPKLILLRGEDTLSGYIDNFRGLGFRAQKRDPNVDPEEIYNPYYGNHQKATQAL